jgi:hypothetical protein
VPDREIARDCIVPAISLPTPRDRADLERSE